MASMLLLIFSLWLCTILVCMVLVKKYMEKVLTHLYFFRCTSNQLIEISIIIVPKMSVHDEGESHTLSTMSKYPSYY